MIRSYRHKRNKQRLMLYFFKVFHNCGNEGHFGSAIDMRMEPMGHMAVGLLIDTSWIYLIR